MIIRYMERETGITRMASGEAIRRRQNRFGPPAVVAQQILHDLHAFAAFCPATTGGIHLIGALALTCRNGLFELPVGQRITNTDIHGHILTGAFTLA